MTALTTICKVPECDTIISSDWLFCERCWRLLPTATRSSLSKWNQQGKNMMNSPAYKAKVIRGIERIRGQLWKEMLERLEQKQHGTL